MRYINITVGSTVSSINLGRRGENEATAVIWDVSSLIETYGSGTAVVMVKRPNDTSAYPVDAEQSDETVTWIVSSTDTYYKGIGAVELFWYVDEVLAKSIVYSTRVYPDIGNTIDEPPDAYETWVETLTALGAETLANATAAETAQAGAEAAQEAAESAQTAAEEAASAAATSESNAAESEENATEQALKSEGYAVGTQDGTAVTSGSPYYQNNAAYYAEVAQQGAEESGYVWFDVNSEDGNMYVTITDNIAEDVSFAVNTTNGTLEVTVDG